MRNGILNLLAVCVKQGRVLGEPLLVSFFSRQSYKLSCVHRAPFSSFSKGVCPEFSVAPLKDVGFLGLVRSV